MGLGAAAASGPPDIEGCPWQKSRLLVRMGLTRAAHLSNRRDSRDNIVVLKALSRLKKKKKKIAISPS